MLHYPLYFRFVTYLSAICDNAVEGKKLLNAAINALFSMPVSEESENNGIDNLRQHTEEKPCLLWSTLYIQELTTVCFLSFTFSPTISFIVLNFCLHLLPVSLLMQQFFKFSAHPNTLLYFKMIDLYHVFAL